MAKKAKRKQKSADNDVGRSKEERTEAVIEFCRVWNEAKTVDEVCKRLGIDSPARAAGRARSYRRRGVPIKRMRVGRKESVDWKAVADAAAAVDVPESEQYPAPKRRTAAAKKQRPAAKKAKAKAKKATRKAAASKKRSGTAATAKKKPTAEYQRFSQV